MRSTGVAFVSAWAATAFLTGAVAFAIPYATVFLLLPPAMAIAHTGSTVLERVSDGLNAMIGIWSEASVTTRVANTLITATVSALPANIARTHSIVEVRVKLWSDAVVRRWAATAIATHVAFSSVDVAITGDPVLMTMAFTLIVSVCIIDAVHAVCWAWAVTNIATDAVTWSNVVVAVLSVPLCLTVTFVCTIWVYMAHVLPFSVYVARFAVGGVRSVAAIAWVTLEVAKTEVFATVKPGPVCFALAGIVPVGKVPISMGNAL
jgi:hypothetical protein